MSSSAWQTNKPLSPATSLAGGAKRKSRALLRGGIPSLSRGWSDLDDVRLARLFSNHGQNAARLGRLLRDGCAVYGPLADPVDRAFDDALDRISAEWGIDLGPRNTPEDAPAELPIDIDELIADLDDKCARLARHLEEIIYNSRRADRKRVTFLHRPLRLEEVD
jgi:hypothetical protein